jgi:hypothetical protein
MYHANHGEDVHVVAPIPAIKVIGSMLIKPDGTLVNCTAPRPDPVAKGQGDRRRGSRRVIPVAIGVVGYVATIGIGIAIGVVTSPISEYSIEQRPLAFVVMVALSAKPCFTLTVRRQAVDDRLPSMEACKK